MQVVARAAERTSPTVGSSIEASTAMIEITTSSSIRLKAFRNRLDDC